MGISKRPGCLELRDVEDRQTQGQDTDIWFDSVMRIFKRLKADMSCFVLFFFFKGRRSSFYNKILSKASRGTGTEFEAMPVIEAEKSITYKPIYTSLYIS